MLEIEQKYELEKKILKTLRLLEITTHPLKKKRLDKKLQGLFKKLQELQTKKQEYIKVDLIEENVINNEKNNGE